MRERAPRADLPHAPGEVLIRFRPTASPAERAAVLAALTGWGIHGQWARPGYE